MEKDKLFSFKAAIFASVPNLALAFLMLVFFLFGFVASLPFAVEVYGVLHIVAGLFEAMYVGLFAAILENFSGTAQQLVATLLYVVSSLPLVLVSMGAYALGIRNIRLFGKASAPKSK